MVRRGISLEEISENYPMILIDTCVLIGYITNDGSVNTPKDSAHFFRKHVDEGTGIYVTSSVFQEYSNGGNHFYRRNLLEALRNNGGIFQLDGGEKLWYDVLSKGYSKIKDKFELAETDYDFLVSGVVLSEARKEPIALVSNDMGILRAWKFFLMKEGLSTVELGFLTRIGDKTFKKVKPPKNYKKL